MIEVSRKKFDGKHIANAEKMKWGRLLVTAASAYSSFYEKSKLDDFEARIKQLEQTEKKKEN